MREFLFEIPAGEIAVVGKERVDADAGLLRLDGVDVVFGLVPFFRDGK